jgi:hypothetical protein
MKKVILVIAAISLMGGISFSAETSGEALSFVTPEVKALVVPARQAPVSTTPKFRDVPEDHWASSSVYDLVNLGVTQGYPDGTFRGNSYITRYETAMFLSKLAAAIGESSDKIDIATEKLKDDLRAEIRALRAEISELKRSPEEGMDKPISGSYSTSIIFGNVVAGNTSVEGQQAPLGPIVRYRLKTSFARSVGDNSRIKINLDTMDSGFGGGSSDLSMKILDIEGNMRLNMGLPDPVDIKVTSGPGPVVHTEEADANGNYIARSENGVVYVRPYNSVMFSSKLFGLDMGLGYIARKLNGFGEVEVNQVRAAVGYNFPGMFFVPSFMLDTDIDYLTTRPQAVPSGPTDTKYTFTATFAGSKKHTSRFIYSAGKGETPHNVLFGMDVSFLDTWDSGTFIDLKYRKVGSAYLYENATLAEDMFAGLDVFNRYIGSGNGLGIVDVGASLSQVLSENTRLVGKADWRLGPDNAYGADIPQSALVIESGVSWDIATDTLFEGMYRVESVPMLDDKSTDMLYFTVAYKF